MNLITLTTLLCITAGAALAEPDVANIITLPADVGCIYCQAFVSKGGGIAGHTSSLMELHVVSSKFDVAFPRALTARLESECAQCQPAAFVAQARGLNTLTTVWAANLEAYSEGRASVVELNIGARGGGYVFDVVPVRMADGTPSQIDAVVKVEGFGQDPGAAHVRSYIDARIRPEQGILVIPEIDGCTTVTTTAAGRMHEDWCRTNGVWSKRLVIDGVTQ